METQKADIARVLELQRLRRVRTGPTTPADRIALLERFRAVLIERHEAFSDAVIADIGKPRAEALGEIAVCLTMIDETIANLAEWMRPITVTPNNIQANPGATARIIYEPKGSVLIFGPWNWPVSLALQPLIGAIAAGNSCILKPSEMTPASSAMCRQAVEEAFDVDLVALFEGGPEVARLLLEFPFDHVFFTGSGPIGKQVMKAAATHLSSVTLELGGKSPVIVDGTLPADLAGQRIAMGKCINAGQACVAPDHIWVERDHRDELVGSIVSHIRANLYPEGTLDETRYGGIVNPQQIERLTRLLDDAVAKGAKIVQGGKVIGRRVEPTVLVDVPRDAAIMQEEIFGPLLPVLAYDEISEVLSELQTRDKPLALYVFSKDDQLVETVLGAVPSGGCTINDVFRHGEDSSLPFGGVGASGIGSYHGIYTFQELSHRRSIFVQHA